MVEKTYIFGEMILSNVKVKYSICSNCNKEIITPKQIKYNGDQIINSISLRFITDKLTS